MTENTGRISTALADRYRVERHLGEGGMATVYLARDLKHNRSVASRLFRPTPKKSQSPCRVPSG